MHHIPGRTIGPGRAQPHRPVRPMNAEAHSQGHRDFDTIARDRPHLFGASVVP